ncbi:MAG: hypothetical protein K2N73_06760 [Lachnospiraceae bacterium]|nr:hypothetical protein [Lachnospiraceae bacterium]
MAELDAVMLFCAYTAFYDKAAQNAVNGIEWTQRKEGLQLLLQLPAANLIKADSKNASLGAIHFGESVLGSFLMKIDGKMGIGFLKRYI